MEDPIALGSYARPIDHGSLRRTHSPWVSGMTQAPGVLKWGAGVGHDQQSLSATCALRGPIPQADSPSARWPRGVPARRQDPSATWV
jgi:hypothetical protein